MRSHNNTSMTRSPDVHYTSVIRFHVSVLIAFCWLTISQRVLADNADNDGNEADNPATELSGKTKPWDVGVSAEVRAAANKLFQLGNEQFTTDRHADALRLYREVLSLWQHPRVHLNAAASCIELERLLEAAGHLNEIRKHRKHLNTDDRSKYDSMVVVVESNTAVVSLKSEQKGAILSIDGEQLLIGPGVASKRMLPGKHSLVTRRAGLESEIRELNVAAGEKLEVTPVLFFVASEWRWTPWKPWALAGVGAALAVSGAPLLLNARSIRKKRSDFEKEVCSDPSQNACVEGLANALRINDYDRSANHRTLLANTAFVVGGAVAVTGIVLAVLNRPTQVKREARDGEAQTSLWLGEDRIGAQVSLRF